MSLNEFDLQVRSHIYDACLRRGRPPLVEELSSLLNTTEQQVQGALTNLAEAHMMVLQSDGGEILMAQPFSAVPTPFLVETAQFSCYANCIWDGLGVAAMLHQDVHIQTSCADCGQALELQVIGGEVRGLDGVIHFALPARRWWADIVFT